MSLPLCAIITKVQLTTASERKYNKLTYYCDQIMTVMFFEPPVRIKLSEKVFSCCFCWCEIQSFLGIFTQVNYITPYWAYFDHSMFPPTLFWRPVSVLFLSNTSSFKWLSHGISSFKIFVPSLFHHIFHRFFPWPFHIPLFSCLKNPKLGKL
jgi:hypothetical protein